MSYSFFASIDDKVQILQFIFEQTDLQVFDSYSSYSKEICEYKSVEDITAKFDLVNGAEYAITFNLYSSQFGGTVLFKRLELNPRYCNGHTFRYSTEGWGLIQLHFGGVNKNGLNQSHIRHFNEKGALKNEPFQTKFGKVSGWNWEAINKTSRSLKYYIHNKLAIRKIGSMGVLTGADLLNKEGVLIRGTAS